MVSSAPPLFSKGFLGIEFCSPNLLFQNFPVLLVALGDEIVPPHFTAWQTEFRKCYFISVPSKTLPLGTNPLGT